MATQSELTQEQEARYWHVLGGALHAIKDLENVFDVGDTDIAYRSWKDVVRVTTNQWFPEE